MRYSNCHRRGKRERQMGVLFNGVVAGTDTL
jgi:hypothetical protein